MSSGLTRLDMYILDALVHDAETVEAIVTWVNDHPDMMFVLDGRDRFSREEAVAGLNRLIRDESAGVYVTPADGGELVQLPAGEFPSGNYDAVWFDATRRGMVRLLNWNE